jgi:hypothetical protein
MSRGFPLALQCLCGFCALLVGEELLETRAIGLRVEAHGAIRTLSPRPLYRQMVLLRLGGRLATFPRGAFVDSGDRLFVRFDGLTRAVQSADRVVKLSVGPFGEIHGSNSFVLIGAASE